MVSFTPQISMMAMIAGAGVRSGKATYAPISPSRRRTRMFCVRIGRVRASVQSEELARVAREDAVLLGRGDLQAVHRVDGLADQHAPLLRVERRVGGEQAVPGAEEGVATAGRRRRAVERSVGVEHAVVLGRAFLQAGLPRDGIFVRL